MLDRPALLAHSLAQLCLAWNTEKNWLGAIIKESLEYLRNSLDFLRNIPGFRIILFISPAMSCLEYRKKQLSTSTKETLEY